MKNKLLQFLISVSVYVGIYYLVIHDGTTNDTRGIICACLCGYAMGDVMRLAWAWINHGVVTETDA